MTATASATETNHQTTIGQPVGVVPAGTPAPLTIRRLELLLIKPSKYDDDGYVMRYFRGVLPSNTLAAISALTDEVVARGDLGDVPVRVRVIDELVEKVSVRKLARKHLRPGVRTVVALCGVQTNQFPRAADLALEFQDAGFTVMMGGFHVSGAIAMSVNGIPTECQELIDAGITLVKGEIEDHWGDLLRDALHGRLATYYDIVSPPDISRASIPVVEPRVMKRFAYPYMGTIDAGRGCPFSCSFCTIINVQGRSMRCRAADMIKDRIRRNVALKIDYYFFTDDNFSRNPNWEEIFDALIELRRDEGLDIQFMMQVDTLSWKTPNFVSKAKEAGCTQVFIGMETVNPENLPAAGKKQNRVHEYRSMIDAWHEQGIACHVGYIIGFPHDTVESVREDVRRLKEEILVDQASFFMLTPLPGSEDHRRMQLAGTEMDEDYNRFDSFHATTKHPRMSGEEWFDAYREAWREFYTVDSMKSILGRTARGNYWSVFKNFVWYKHSVDVDSTHPMICGFFRLKDRKQRRPGYAVEPGWKHYPKRLRDVARWGRDVVKLFFEMQEVWLATRGRPGLQENLDEIKNRYDQMRDRLAESASRAGQALGRQVASVRAGAEGAWQRAGEVSRHAADDISTGFDHLRGRTGFWRAVKRGLSRCNPFSVRLRSRSHLNSYWKRTSWELKQGQVFQVNPFTFLYNLAADVRLSMIFSLAMLFSYGK